MKTFRLIGMALMTAFMSASLTSCGNSTNKTPEVLFENMYIGDNIETCLAKGSIQYQYGNEFKLAKTNIVETYFSYNEVKFDINNIVKEIELTFRQKNEGKTADEVFSYMTQYFCQRYTGMKSETFSDEKRHEKYELEYWHKGVKNIWETDKIKIILKSYTNSPIAGVYHSELEYNTAVMAGNEVKGHWVKLNIIAK